MANQETSKILVRGLAHEIRNPLGGIRGQHPALGRALTDPDLQDYTEIIISESDRLRNLVDRMLRPPSGDANRTHQHSQYWNAYFR